MSRLEDVQKLYPGDLDANRGGKLSERQKQDHIRAAWTFIIMFGAAFVVIAAVMLISLFFVKNGWVVTVILALPLYFVGRVLRVLRRTLAMRREEVQTGTVTVVRGVAAHIHMTRGANLMIEDVQIFVPTPILEQIEPGERYRMYYLPRSKTFISIEPLK